MSTTTLIPQEAPPTPASLANIERIETSREEALEALAKYRDALRKGGEHPWAAEDAAIVQAYRALAKGRPVIDLREAIMHGGVHADGLPRFAVCRSDARTCFCQTFADGGVRFGFKTLRPYWYSRGSAFVNEQRFPEDTLPRTSFAKEARGQTVVPMVPAPLRPPHKLSGYLTLWEVEKWLPLPPHDPFLLKWLGRAVGAGGARGGSERGEEGLMKAWLLEQWASRCLTPLAIVVIFTAAALWLAVDIVRDLLHRRRMARLAAEQRPAVPRVATCHHGIRMMEECPHCRKWLHEHLHREPQNPRRG